MSDVSYNRSLHLIALLTAAATFPLIFMGGLVTSHAAGMSVPDWPNSYGYNMFLFPPRLWIGGIFYEHTHRLMGTVVGFLSILFALRAWGVSKNAATRRALWILTGISVLLVIISGVIAIEGWGSDQVRRLIPHVTIGFGSLALVLFASTFARQAEPRRWVRWLSLTVLVAVIIQGSFGGTRVTQVNLTLAIIHGCFAQAFFCLTALACVVTSEWWAKSSDLSATWPGTRLVALTATCVLAVYIQLIIGAVMRHHHAGLAIPDLPLAYGSLLPPMTSADLASANAQLSKLAYQSGDRSLPASVTFFQVWIHFAHRIGALVVTGFVLAVATAILRWHRRHKQLLLPAILLLFLIVTQLTLGVLTVLLRKPADLTSLHVATGALLLVTCFVLSIRAARLYSPHFRRSRAVFPVDRSPENACSPSAVPV